MQETHALLTVRVHSKREYALGKAWSIFSQLCAQPNEMSYVRWVVFFDVTVIWVV